MGNNCRDRDIELFLHLFNGTTSPCMSPYAELFFPTHHSAEERKRNGEILRGCHWSKRTCDCNQRVVEFIHSLETVFTLPCAFCFILSPVRVNVTCKCRARIFQFFRGSGKQRSPVLISERSGTNAKEMSLFNALCCNARRCRLESSHLAGYNMRSK